MAGDGEPPRPSRPRFASVGHPDTRADRDRVWHGRRRRVVGVVLQAKRAEGIAQVHAGPRRVDPEGGTDEARAARQAMVRDPVQAEPRRTGPGIRSTGAPATIPGEAVGSHLLHAEQRLDGADEHSGRTASWLRDHVQTVVHPIDKVHVRESRRPSHDPVSDGGCEAGVRGAVVGTPVGLDLDDAGFAPPGLVIADQARAEQPRGSLFGRAGQLRSIEDAQAGVLG